MTILNPLAVTNADVLRALVAEPRPVSIAAIARDLGRDKSNLHKTLKVLAEAGLVGGLEDPGVPALTPAAQDQLAAIAQAEEAPNGAVAVLHADLRENPLNPRQAFDADELGELADSIAEAGLLQPLLVTPADDKGARMILAGARRWRAIGWMIEDGRWPADRRLPALERAPDQSEAAQAQFLGLIENGRRTPLTFLEEARGYRTLIDATQWSASEAARRTGKAPRVVQEMLKVLAEATPAQLASLEAGEITAKELRYAVRTPDPEGPKTVTEAPNTAAGDLTPVEILTLVEIQAVCALRPVKSPLGPACTATELKLEKWPVEAGLAKAGYISVREGYTAQIALLGPALALLSGLRFTAVEPARRLRCAREDAFLPSQDIDELEAIEAFSRGYLNEAHPPKKLTAAEALILLEVWDIRNGWPGAEIDPARDDAARAEIESLKARGLIEGPRDWEHREHIDVSWDGKRALERAHPGYEKLEARAKHIADLVETLGLEIDAESVATPWLNGPYDLPPEIAAQAAEEAAKAREQEVARDRQRQAEADHRQKLADTVEAFAAEVATLSPDDRSARFSEVLETVGGPAPWSFSSDQWEFARAANGARVTVQSNLSRRLVVIAMNMAAGVDLAALASAQAESADPATPSRHVFEGWIRARFHALHPEIPGPALAEPAKFALNRYLDDAGEDGGPGEFEDVADETWTRDIADEIADGYLEDYELSEGDEHQVDDSDLAAVGDAAQMAEA